MYSLHCLFLLPPQSLTVVFYLFFLPLPSVCLTQTYSILYTLRATHPKTKPEGWKQKKITFSILQLALCLYFILSTEQTTQRSRLASLMVRHDSVWSGGKAAVLLMLKLNHNVSSIWPECWHHLEMHVKAVFVCVCLPSFLFNQRVSGAEQSGGLNQGPFCRSGWL